MWVGEFIARGHELSPSNSCLLRYKSLYLRWLNEIEMRIRPYSKSELAQAYAPEITPQAALNRLAAWIKLNRPLREALDQTGYYPRQRLFTARQVALIFEYLGEP